ncbi:MAG: ribosomal protein L7/L12 [Akkermansia sp.]|nr:ribosomal protein L7/L12 [Akkermansia sp.]
MGIYLRGFKMQQGTLNPVIMYPSKGLLHSLTAKELVKRYLQHIRTQVEGLVYHGEKITGVTLTRPVKFSPAQCEDLKQAAQEAGFSAVTFTTEPEAAGLAFCRLNVSKAFKRSALIVDWGGGTLDMALVTRDGNTIKTHSKLTDGDTTMGGEKFDEKLWTHVLQTIEAPLNHTTQLPKVRRAKEMLSSRESFPLRLSSETGACPPLSLTRSVFNQLIAAEINQAVQKVQELLARIPAEYKPDMLLLVGGSSRIPLIKEKLEAACHLPALSWDKSRDAVALGAALWEKADDSLTSQPTIATSETGDLYELALAENAEVIKSLTKGRNAFIPILQQVNPNLSLTDIKKIQGSHFGIVLKSATKQSIYGGLAILKQNGLQACATAPLSVGLRAAIAQDNIPLVQDLLKQGADLNAAYLCDDSIETPLTHALLRHNAKLVKLLLEAGADIEQRPTNDSIPPLHYVVSLNDDQELVRLLIKSGANINACDDGGDTPLHVATDCAADINMRLLLQAGANIEAQNAQGQTPLHFATEQEDETVISLLINHGANVNAQTNDGRTPLHWAARNDAAKVLPILLNHGANVHEKDNDGWTPLHWASFNDAATVLPILLNHGANVHEKDNDGRTPLHAAAAEDAETVLPILLNHGANVHEKDNDGRTPLHIATKQKSNAIVSLLLNHGASINEQTNEGNTAQSIDQTSIKLSNAGKYKIDVINVLWEICPHLTLGQAKKLVDSAPIILPFRFTQQDAITAVQMLTQVGAKVEIINDAPSQPSLSEQYSHLVEHAVESLHNDLHKYPLHLHSESTEEQFQQNLGNYITKIQSAINQHAKPLATQLSQILLNNGYVGNEPIFSKLQFNDNATEAICAPLSQAVQDCISRHMKYAQSLAHSSTGELLGGIAGGILGIFTLGVSAPLTAYAGSKLGKAIASIQTGTTGLDIKATAAALPAAIEQALPAVLESFRQYFYQTESTPVPEKNRHELFHLVERDEWGKAMKCIENGHFTKDTLQIALSYAHSETMKNLISRYL